jgi:hypothetical protein
MSRYLAGLFCVLLVSITGTKHSNATHFMGGEITWECTPHGNFRFTMLLYRECYSSSGTPAAFFDDTIQMQSNAPGFSTIQMIRVSTIDMSPICGCPNGPNISCNGMIGGLPNQGAMQELVYTSDAAYPSGVPLSGVPPATGWYFGYGVCCRNPCNNIDGATSKSFFVRAIMYPYKNTPVNTCFDNSPRFIEKPSMVICTGYPFKYHFTAIDHEHDSLIYEWDTPLDNDINTPIATYAPTYSFISPLPGPLQNPNNSLATLDSQTGTLSLTLYTNGAYVSVVKVTAYRCGIKIAEIFREMQVVLLSCGQNNPPNVTPPFQNAIGQFTLFTDTVYAGQFVTFSISATDFEYCPGATPTVPQTMKLFAIGSQFGAPINQGGCLYPPCATLTPSPAYNAPLSGAFGVQTTFSWGTSCAHVINKSDCYSAASTHHFLFKTMDNFCPAPAITNTMVTIVVKDYIPIAPLDSLSIQLSGNSDILLTWQPPQGNTTGFIAYYLYSAESINDSFVLIDSIFNITDSAYLHQGALSNQNSICYLLSTRSLGCKDYHEIFSDTVCFSLIDIPEWLRDPKAFYLGQNIPNPTTGSVIIPFRTPEAVKVSLTVRDSQGKIHFVKHLHSLPGDNLFEADLSKLSPGVYFYSIHYGDLRLTKKMIVQ